MQELHQEVRGVGRGSGRLPDDRVPHQRRARRQVRADRGEVEGRDGEDEALERPVLHPVPHALARDRLLLVDPRHELDVEAVEVDHLAGRVDLGLVRGLRLAEHRRGVERRAPRAGQELGCAEEDRGALLPGAGATSPPRPRRRRGSPCPPRPAPPWWASARTWLFLCGITISAVVPVVTSSPPITSGSSMRSDCIWSSRRRSCSRSGEPGAYSLTGSFVGAGGRKMPGALIGLILRFRPCPQRTSATRRGVGVWGRSGSRDRLLHHELPRPAVEQRGKSHPLGDRFVRYFAGEPDDFLDVSIELDGATEFELELTRGAAATQSRRDGDVRRAGRARRASERTACSGIVLRSQPLLDRGSLPPGRGGRRARLVRLARRRVQATAAGARRCRCLRSCETSWPGSSRNGTATGSRSSPGWRTRPGACTSTGAGRSGCTSTSRAPRLRVAPSASSVSSA